MARLKAELEKVKEEHKQQITQVTDSATSEIDKAKAELVDREKTLRIEIEALKQEKQALADSDKQIGRAHV